jgi:CubicO group peptidase (beta-lactamase class C family)
MEAVLRDRSRFNIAALPELRAVRRGTGRLLRGLRFAAIVGCAGAVIPPALATSPQGADFPGALVPSLESYIAKGMKTYDAPGVAIGIVAGDKLVYSKGFGVRSKSGGAPVDPGTVFQIGSTTKAFLAATIAIMVDRGKLHWDDRVVDLAPDFQLQDPWVTREFRVFDLLAQRSGLPAEVNDGLGMLGYPEADLIRSLRYVAPVSSFRSTFSYTNITHLQAGRIVAQAGGARDWNDVLQKDLLDPLAMKETSYTAAAIEAAPDHAMGYRWTPKGSVEVPFTQIFPYDYYGAGDINSTIDDMSRWVRLQLGTGSFEGHRLVSEANLEVTRLPRIAMAARASYASGWVVQQTPNGEIVWHNGGTPNFGAYVGLLPEKNIGVIVLTNEENIGLPDAIGRWTLDRILANPEVDYVAIKFKSVRDNYAAAGKLFNRPANPRPAPPIDNLTGAYVNPAFGKVSVNRDGEASIMTFETTGAAVKLEPWDGNVLTATYIRTGRFAAMADSLGPLPLAFVQLQMGQPGKQDLLRLTFPDDQSYDFVRKTE